MVDKVKKVRLHGPIGTYEYNEDNTPLKNLANNDVILQRQIDLLYERLKNNLDVDYTRADFPPLKPAQGSIETQLYVNPGSFICRMPSKSGPMDAYKSLGSGINTATNGTERGRRIADTGSVTEFHGMGESQRNSVVFFPGGGVSFDDWSDNDFNWARDGEPNPTGPDGNQVPDAPQHRMDLVCVQGFPSTDQFGKHNTQLGVSGIPWLVVVKGAGFRNTPLLNDNDEPVLANALSTGRYKEEDIRITMSKPRNPYLEPDYNHASDTGVSKYRLSLRDDESAGLLTARTYGMGKTSVELITENRTFGTVPAPDDVVNSSYHIVPGLDDNFQAVVSSTAIIAEINSGPGSEVGLFTIPIAYVKIPKGYTSGPIQASWIQDIRPLFRSSELTVSERQALAASFQAQASNRVMTIRDSEYQYLVNYILQEDQWNVFETRGQRDISLGNHEGRLRAMEACIDRPKLQAAPTYSNANPDLSMRLNPKYVAPYYHLPSWAAIYGAGPVLDNGSDIVRNYPRHGGLYYQYGQHIPCVRNYMDRFYTTRYNCKLWAEVKNEFTAHGQQVLAYGTEPSLVRRLQIRKPFLTYSTEAWDFENNASTSKYPAESYIQEHRRNQQTKCYWPGYPAKYDDSMLTPHSRYKFQQVEVDLVFPEWDPDRDAVEECQEVWQSTPHDGLGWTGFGHGGSRTYESEWVTVCNTYGGNKTVQSEFPQWSIPLGVVPYFVDCDALGFAQGLIDTLNIEVINLVDSANDRGCWTHYRFNGRSPMWNGLNDHELMNTGEINLGPPDVKYLTADERKGTVPTEGLPAWVWGAVGETQTFKTSTSQGEWEYKVHQVSPGYSGFCVLVHMPVLQTGSRQGAPSWFHGLIGHLHNVISHFPWDWHGIGRRDDRRKVQGFAAKRAKIKISGPAHRYLNGAYLPYPSNSDQGGVENTTGASWID